MHACLITGDGARRVVYTCEFRVTENMDPLEISKAELKELSRVTQLIEQNLLFTPP